MSEEEKRVSKSQRARQFGKESARVRKKTCQDDPVYCASVISKRDCNSNLKTEKEQLECMCQVEKTLEMDKVTCESLERKKQQGKL